MNHQQDKVELYIERVNMDRSYFDNYKKTQWKLESNINRLKEIENILQKEIKKEENSKKTEDCETCAICLESLYNKTTVSTKCQHSFCYECVEANRKYNQHTGSLCTICRADII
tara:strand:- start:4 stop:345 length:342 start_codon:yes stop_codon:yes gene_type:complete